ncbi:cytochrome P450 2G1-like [Aplysia californica]|uniref:Cytochrome P450 2G1-like n=1 Tax=Aplysia californica TaxID=6500 RepID=A0ABM1VRZ1_APLCA|nr:cytochrome P450 2G1-like [Aplysia californica]
MLLETVLSLSATSWLLVIVGVVTLIYFLTSDRDNRKLPPSPGLALPIVGHLYMMERNPLQQLRKWRERLGDIFMLRMGSTNMVFLNGHDVLKEALVKKADVFSDRPLAALRHIFPDVDVYVKELLKHKGQPTELRSITNMSVSNVICAIIFGRRYELYDKRFAKMMGIFQEVPSPMQTNPVESGMTVSLEETSASRWVSGNDSVGFQTSTNGKQFLVIPQIYKEICEHIGTHRVPTIQDKPKLKYLQAVIYETLRLANIVPLRRRECLFSLTFFFCCPFVPSPYISTHIAFSFPPNSLTHMVTEDTELRGYVIPKGTFVVPNLYSALMDEKVWGDPQNFRPERFLDSQENIVKREEMIPFSLGNV